DPDTGVQTTTAVDGQGAWSGTGRKISDVSPAGTKTLSDEFSRRPTVFSHVGEPEYDFHLVGRTQYQQIPVYAIEATVRDVSPSTFFVDQSNYLVHSVTFSQKSDDGSAQNVFVEYSEYRPVGSSLVPFKQIEFVNGKPIVERNLDSVAFGAQPDSNTFKRPDAAIAPKLTQPVMVPFEYTRQEILVKVRLNSG